MRLPVPHTLPRDEGAEARLDVGKVDDIAAGNLVDSSGGHLCEAGCSGSWSATWGIAMGGVGALSGR